MNLLVSGAGGQSGSLTVRAMAARGVPVKALVRSAERAREIGELRGVSLVEADMLDRDSLLPVLAGVERMLMISSSNDRMVETQCNFIDACVEAGVRQVIKFSGEESQVGYDPGRFRFTREHEQIEDYLEDSGLVWTHLRPSQFMQVYLREAMSMREKGGLFLALGGIRMSPVDLRDVAEIAAKLLAGGGHEGEALRITGPEALSMAEIAAIVGRVTGREVRYEPISVAERRRMLLDGRMPEWFVDAVTDQTEERLKHPEARVDLRTHELFGVKATRFEEFVRRHVEVFGG